MNSDTLDKIVQSGLLAPSADNRHVFEYEVAESSINLWANREFAALTERHRRILGLISLGAVVENMRTCAGALGYETNIQWPLSDGESNGLLASLVFWKSAPTNDGLALAIPDRRTNRSMYRGPGLSDFERSCFVGELDSSSKVQLIWLQGQARWRALKLLWLAESERFLRKSLHQEIFASIRFDLSWNESAQWALPPGALEIEAPMRPFFKALRHWPLMRILNIFGAHYLVGLRAGWFPCWQAPSLAVLVTSEPLEQGAISTGAALERIWLLATRLNLALQPLAASVVLPFQDSSDNGASEQLRLALTNGWREIVSDARPLMVFRLGRAKLPAVRSSRLPQDHYRRSRYGH